MPVETGSGYTPAGKEYSYKLTGEANNGTYEICLKDVVYTEDGDTVYTSHPFSIGGHEWELEIFFGSYMRFFKSHGDTARRLELKDCVNRICDISSALPVAVAVALEELFGRRNMTLSQWLCLSAPCAMITDWLVGPFLEEDGDLCSRHCPFCCPFLRDACVNVIGAICETGLGLCLCAIPITILFPVVLILMLALAIAMSITVITLYYALIAASVALWLPAVILSWIIYGATYPFWATTLSLSARLKLKSIRVSTVTCKATAIHRWWSIFNKTNRISLILCISATVWLVCVGGKKQLRTDEALEIENFAAIRPCLRSGSGYLSNGWITLRVNICVEGVVQSQPTTDVEVQLTRFQPEATAETETSVVQIEEQEEEELCVYCLCKPRTSGFAHNNTVHVCMCEPCAKEYGRRKDVTCPLCREKIDYVVYKIY